MSRPTDENLKAAMWGLISLFIATVCASKALDEASWAPVPFVLFFGVLGGGMFWAAAESDRGRR